LQLSQNNRTAGSVAQEQISVETFCKTLFGWLRSSLFFRINMGLMPWYEIGGTMLWEMLAVR